MFSKDRWALAAGALWLMVAGLATTVIGDTASGSARWVEIVVRVVLVITWTAVFMALAVPSTVSLTVIRLLTPVSIVMAAIGFGGDSKQWVDISLLTVAVGCSALVLSAEVGRVYVQGSAYGDETRTTLRPPVWVPVVVPVLWGLVMGTMVVAVAGADERWWPLAALSLVFALALGALLARATHQLSRRWLVLVPAGLVVHDPLILADSVMLPRLSIGSVHAALVGTTAIDCTGGTAGLPLEIELLASQPLAFAGRPGHPGARAEVVDALLVAPTRPGRFLQAALDHRLPVGTPPSP
jgi:hypothetical protein